MDNIKLLTLRDYLDKSQICAILCQNHYDFFYKVNTVALLPLILGSSILTILNSSSISEDIMKIINITVNGTNAVLMALLNNYKIVERVNSYKTLYNKYNLLSHKIESIINNTDEITNDIVNNIISEYDIIQNDNPYSYLDYYKKKIVRTYAGKKKLPNSLQLDADMVLININEVKA